MKIVYRIHLLSLCLYGVGIVSSVCFFILVDNLLNIHLPTWILALVVLLCLILSAALRLSVWGKRDKLLSSEEMNSFGVRIFFLIAWFEIAAAIIGAGLFFL